MRSVRLQNKPSSGRSGPRVRAPPPSTLLSNGFRFATSQGTICATHEQCAIAQRVLAHPHQRPKPTPYCVAGELPPAATCPCGAFTLYGRVAHMPEMAFLKAYVEIEHLPSGTTLVFDAVGSLVQWAALGAEHDEDSAALPTVAAAHSAHWRRVYESSGLRVENWDWTYATDYAGATRGRAAGAAAAADPAGIGCTDAGAHAGALVAACGDTLFGRSGAGTAWERARCGSPSTPDEAPQFVAADAPLDRDAVRAAWAKAPPSFRSSVVLFEDFMHDNGVSTLTAHVLCGDGGFFVLLRHWVVVLGKSARAVETRLFHEYGTAVVRRERSASRADLADPALRHLSHDSSYERLAAHLVPVAWPWPLPPGATAAFPDAVEHAAYDMLVLPGCGGADAPPPPPPPPAPPAPSPPAAPAQAAPAERRSALCLLDGAECLAVAAAADGVATLVAAGVDGGRVLLAAAAPDAHGALAAARPAAAALAPDVGDVSSVAFAGGGAFLLVGGGRGAVRLYAVDAAGAAATAAARLAVGEDDARRPPVHALCASEDGRCVAAAAGACVALVAFPGDTAAAATATQLSPLPSRATDLAWSTGDAGASLVACHARGARVWTEGGRGPARDLPCAGAVLRGAASLSWAAGGTYDGTVRLWTRGAHPGRTDNNGDGVVGGFDGPLTDVGVVVRGGDGAGTEKRLASVWGAGGRSLQVWHLDATEGVPVALAAARWRAAVCVGHDAVIHTCAARGDHLATGDKAGTVRLYRGALAPRGRGEQAADPALGVATLAPDLVLTGAGGEALERLAWAGDGVLAGVTQHGAVCLWAV